MADTKLTALTALASASTDDLLYIVDDPAGTPTQKKITVENLLGGNVAPTDAQYVTLATNATLANERVLTAGTAVDLTDAGAGSTVTVDLDFTEFTEETTVAAGDHVPFIDDPGGSPLHRKCTVTNLLSGKVAPPAGEYWVETAHADLSAEVVVGTTGITTAAYASRQAAAKAGRLFLPNDGFVLERDTGAAWAPWGPLFPFTAPVSGDFAWINQSSATLTTTFGGIVLDSPSASGAYNWNIRKKSAPSTPYTITAAMLFNRNGIAGGYSQGGLIFRQSSDGKFIAHMVSFHDGLNTTDPIDSGIQQNKFTSATVISAAYQYFSGRLTGPVVWLRIADDGANRICSWSNDGQSWIALHTVGRTDFLTADEVGFAVNPYSAQTQLTLLSWKEA